MKARCFAILLTACFFILPTLTHAKMKLAEYALTNECLTSVQVEVLSHDGKVLSKKQLNPAKSMRIGTAERIIIRHGDAVREYALPGKMHLHLASQDKTNAGFTSMLGGKWQLSITSGELLPITCVKGGEVGGIPDLTQPPVGFPLRPRRAEETFEQYLADLSECKRAILKAGLKE